MRINKLIKKLSDRDEDALDRLRFACKAFKNKHFPDAWLAVGDGDDDDWYDWEFLFDIPVYHTQTPHHEPQDGEHLQLVPLWKGDISTKSSMLREFRLRLEDSGDF